MQINFTVFATGVILAGNKLRYKAYQADSPAAEVASITEDPPHTFPHPVTLNVPNPVVHIVKIFSTPDASTGTLISEFLYDPTFTNVEIRLPLQLLVGGINEFDPEPDSNEVVIPFLSEWPNLWYPERRANGGTMADFEYTKNGTGFELIGFDTFADGELIFIHFAPKISTSDPTFNYLNLFSDVDVLTADITLDASHYRKLLKIAALGTSITVTLPAIETIPDLTLWYFTTFMGNQKQCTISTNAGDEFFKLSNGDSTKMYLGSNEKFWVMKWGDAFEVIDVSDGVFRVGAQVESFSVLPNTAIMDGSQLPGNDYPRAKNYVLTLPAGYVASKAQKESGNIAYAAMWGYDAGTNVIFLPDWRGMHKRALPGNSGRDPERNNVSVPGDYKAGKMLDHKHWTVVNGSLVSGQFPNEVGRGIEFNRSMVTAYGKTSGGGKESYFLAGAPNTADVPDFAPTSGINTGGGGTQNTVNSAAAFFLVYI